jgi:hypothetical protein
MISRPHKSSVGRCVHYVVNTLCRRGIAQQLTMMRFPAVIVESAGTKAVTRDGGVK